MDAAKGVKGQGRPLYADPRSNDSVHEPCRRQGRMSGQAFLVTFSATGKSDSPVRGETKIRNHCVNKLVREAQAHQSQQSSQLKPLLQNKHCLASIRVSHRQPPSCAWRPYELTNFSPHSLAINRSMVARNSGCSGTRIANSSRSTSSTASTSRNCTRSLGSPRR